MTQQVLENENTNLRIKAMLAEFLNPEFDVENVHPYSTSQQNILRIYEEGALNSNVVPDDIQAILDKFKQTDEKKRPTKSEFVRYKLWLDQKYRSPYTGEMIPLGKLFTSAYEIEHIIPQSRYFDDSFSNKVICETEVNKLKDNQLGYEFIKNHHGEKVTLSFGKIVEILTIEAYEKFVKNNYERNRGKIKKLLMDEIPDKFIERQLNDSRYISKVVKCLLSNIVREKDEQEAISKNVIPCNGSVTDRLKKDWGMNDIWNSIVLPRFERLNQLTGKNVFTTESNGHIIPSMPLELQKGFNKKRIDHRHHAMDAIVIACATRSHVNLLNNESARSENKTNRYQLSHKLRRYEKVVIDGKEREIPKEFILPWDTFPQDTYSILDNIVVSFKQNLRVINKTTNYYQHYNNEGKKVLIKQEKGDSWAVRKPMHKDTVYALVRLRKIQDVRLSEVLKNPQSIVDKDLKNKIMELLIKGFDEKKIKKYFEENKDVWAEVNLSKISIYYFTNVTDPEKERFFATRKSLDTSFDRKKIEESVTDTGIQKILLCHLEKKENNPELAFSPDGIDELNRNIKELNGEKNHQPIQKVRVYEKANKYAVGEKGNKKTKYVEAAKGTNLYFAVYQSKTLEKVTGIDKLTRSYATVPLNMAIECHKTAGKNWKMELDSLLKKEKYISEDAKLLFILSPNDFVYLPQNEEYKSGQVNKPLDKSRIYKMVSSSGNRCFFIKQNIAKPIIDKYEFSPLNKMERAITDEMIKETCLPIKIDRLGNMEIV
jgi:CRISPR-associated endonuclease Csn1